MSDCWQNGGPEWLSEIPLIGGIAIAACVLLFRVIKADACLFGFGENNKTFAGHMLNSGGFFLGSAVAGVVTSNYYLAVPAMALLPAIFATKAIARSARRQVADMPGYPALPWAAICSPVRWSLPVVGGLAAAATVGSVLAGAVLGRAC